MSNSYKWPLILVTLLWAVGSWYVYTCTIKGFCRAEAPDPTPVVTPVPDPEPVVEEPLDLKPIINEEAPEPEPEPEPEPTPEPVAQKQCDPYLWDNIRLGQRNNYGQVQKLEAFLRDYRDEDVPEDGFYGRDDDAAVRRLQVEYASDVLAPWGLSTSTGNVMSTTRKKINELYCAQQ